MSGIELKPDAADVIMRVVYLTQDTILVIQDREEEAKFIEARQLLRQWLSDWADRKEPDQSERVSRLEEALKRCLLLLEEITALALDDNLFGDATNEELWQRIAPVVGRHRRTGALLRRRKPPLAALNDGGSDAG